MLENRDPAIKLFGKTIPLPSCGELEEDKGVCSKRESEGASVCNKYYDDKEKDDDEAMMRSPPMEVASSEQETTSTVVEEKKSNNKGEEEKEKEKEKEKAAAVMKKPDKILPCPRCNSLDTKFCYYNNYNVNQPRYFCKNCQRYWTAGGTMRNVPVGAGRRKNKSNTSLYRHLVEPAIPSDPSLRPNATTVLSFASSSDTTPHLVADKKTIVNNGFHQIDEQGSSNSPDDPPALMPYVNWPPYPWNHPAAPIPIPLYPAPPPYWATWTTLPWSSGVTLGKHSREGNVLTAPPKQSNSNNLWFPKTLRIDDPEEAAKSSIWTTMGFKNDKAGGMFEAFQSKAELRNHAQQPLHANPAAMSRSLNFQETS